MQAPVRRLYSEVVKGVTAKNLHKEAKAQRETNVNSSPCQKSEGVLSYVNETSTDLACHVTDKDHNFAEQSITTKPGFVEVPAEPPDHSTKVSNQSRAQVKNDVNAPQEYCVNLATKPEGDCKSSQQTAEKIVTTVQESSKQQDCTTMEENTIKKHHEPRQIPQSNKADNDTNWSTSSYIQRVNIRALAPHVQEISTAAPNHAANNMSTAATDTGVKLGNSKEVKVSLSQEAAVKPKRTHSSTLKAFHQNKTNKSSRNVTRKEEMNVKGHVGKEKQRSAITPAEPPESKVHTEGRWHPFTVNKSCSRKARCRHNPGTGLPPNVQKW